MADKAVAAKAKELRSRVAALEDAIGSSAQGLRTAASGSRDCCRAADRAWTALRNASRRALAAPQLVNTSLEFGRDWFAAELDLESLRQGLAGLPGVVSASDPRLTFPGASPPASDAWLLLDEVGLEIDLVLDLAGVATNATVGIAIYLAVSGADGFPQALRARSARIEADQQSALVDAMRGKLHAAVDEKLGPLSAVIADRLRDLADRMAEPPYGFEPGKLVFADASLWGRLRFLSVEVNDRIAFNGHQGEPQSRFGHQIRAVEQAESQSDWDRVLQHYGTTPSVAKGAAVVRRALPSPAVVADGEMVIRIGIEQMSRRIERHVRDRVRALRGSGVKVEYLGTALVVNPDNPALNGWGIVLTVKIPIPPFCVGFRLVIQGLFPWNWYFECTKWSPPQIWSVPVSGQASMGVRKSDRGVQLLFVGGVLTYKVEQVLFEIEGATSGTSSLSAEGVVVRVQR